MNWFLDMCILIFYAEKGQHQLKVESFVNEKKENKFVICQYITNENMPKWITRQEGILHLITSKAKDNSYEYEKAREYDLLLQQDKIKLKKLLALLSSAKDKNMFIKEIKRNQYFMLQRIHYFLTNLIDKEIVPIALIDQELKRVLVDFLHNHSDALTLASGIQYHNTGEHIAMITGDRKDWTKENLQWVHDSRPDLAKKYPSLPKIEYI